jgi:hemerythrin superfamily protein
MITPSSKPDPNPGKPVSEQQPAAAAGNGAESAKAASASPTDSQRSEMNTQKKTTGTAKSGTDNENQSAIELLKADHQEVSQLFEKFKGAKGRQQRKKLVEQIAVALAAHTIIEEEIFYPACSKHGVDEDNLDEAQVEHDTIKMLVNELLDGNSDDDYYDAKVTVLSEYVKHHVKEEEEPEKGIFARAEKTDLDLADLGQELKERKEELMEDEERLLDRPPRIRSLQQLRQSSPSSRSSQSSRYSGSGSRDYGHEGREQSGRSGGYSGGRESGGYGGGYGASRYPRSSGRSEWAGGSEGSDLYYGSSDRDFDEDRYQGGASRDWQERGGYEGGGSGGGGQRRYRSGSAMGHGGWYGDPEEHSQAARRGWRNRDY